MTAKEQVIKRDYPDIIYVVFMEGATGIYETRCLTAEEAVRLETHHRQLGWYAWIEIEKIKKI